MELELSLKVSSEPRAVCLIRDLQRYMTQGHNVECVPLQNIEQGAQVCFDSIYAKKSWSQSALCTSVMATVCLRSLACHHSLPDIFKHHLQ